MGNLKHYISPLKQVLLKQLEKGKEKSAQIKNREEEQNKGNWKQPKISSYFRLPAIIYRGVGQSSTKETDDCEGNKPQKKKNVFNTEKQNIWERMHVLFKKKKHRTNHIYHLLMK